jgi:hypothetical protein
MSDVWTEITTQLQAMGPKSVAKSWFPDDRLSQLEIYDQLLAGIAIGYLVHVAVDPDYPQFSAMLNSSLNIAAPVPDYMYFNAAVNGEGVYRISGVRGTSRFAEIGIFRNLEKIKASGKPLPRSAGQIDLDQLTIGPNGRFEMLLSAQRPNSYTGDWVHMDPITDMLLMRCAACDWYNEIDPRVSIERLDVPAIRPRPTVAQRERKLRYMPGFARESVDFWLDHIAAQRKKLPENEIKLFDYMAIGGLPGQDYLEGIYNLQPDEGLIIETNVPAKYRYWSILVTDDKFGTIDWVNHQSSLNDMQARVDADGKFRCVIALRDPGVPNWVDTGEYSVGLIQMRWNNCDSSPRPTSKLVKLADLRRHLPADTPCVTPEQREAQLRHRRQGALLRRRW